MLRNYILVAVRNLLKNKRYLVINTFGLGIALACCITSYILVAYNIEFDNFHSAEKMQNIYRLHANVMLNGSDYSEAIGAPTPDTSKAPLTIPVAPWAIFNPAFSICRLWILRIASMAGALAK